MLRQLTATAAAVIMLGAVCAPTTGVTPNTAAPVAGDPYKTATIPKLPSESGPAIQPPAENVAQTPERRDLMKSLSEQERACLGYPATLSDLTHAVAHSPHDRARTIQCLNDGNEFELYVITGQAEKLAKDLAKTPLDRDTKFCIWTAVKNLENPPVFATNHAGAALTYYVEAQKRAKFIMLTIPTYCVDVNQPEILEADVASGRLDESKLEGIRTIICTIDHIGGITKWANLFLPHGEPYEAAMIPAQEICGVNPPML